MYNVPLINVRVREYLSTFWVEVEHDGFVAEVTYFLDSREEAERHAKSALRTAREILNIVNNRCAALQAIEGACPEDERNCEIPVDGGDDPG